MFLGVGHSAQRDTADLGCCSAHQVDCLFGHRDPLASLSMDQEVLPPAPIPTALLLAAGSCVELWPLRPAGRTPEGSRLGTQRSKEGQPATSSLPALVRLAHSAAINNPCSLLPNSYPAPGEKLPCAMPLAAPRPQTPLPHSAVRGHRAACLGLLTLWPELLFCWRGGC